jgi:ribulose-5-phosphate 4-epimerase/fuculose-1-phosphate aldolase
MIKGLAGHGYHDELIVLDNTAHEEDPADSLAAAIRAHPASSAVLVRRHGIYVWGPSWEKAMIQSECLHYLYECVVKMATAVHVLSFSTGSKPLQNDRTCYEIGHLHC